QMTSTIRLSAAALTLVFSGGLIGAPSVAGASEEGRRNTANALAVAAGYLLLTQKDKVPGLIGAGAAAYAYKKHQDSVNERHRQEAYYRYDGDRYYRRYRRDASCDRDRDRHHENSRFHRDRRDRDRDCDERGHKHRRHHDS